MYNFKNFNLYSLKIIASIQSNQFELKQIKNFNNLILKNEKLHISFITYGYENI